MGASRTLITGAGGYLGERLARRILETTDSDVVLWFHATERDERARKRGRLARGLRGFEDRIEYAAGDLRSDLPFEAVEPRGLTQIVHGAAVTRFNVEEDLARRVNVEGSEKVFRFARLCPEIEQVALVSTVYTSGLATGDLLEEPFDGSAGFANHYERSKWLSEQTLLESFGDLPWTILRVATVIADDDTGFVRQQNAFHNTLRLFYYGLLSLVPGREATPLYFVTGDFVVSAIATLLDQPAKRGIYHVVHPRENSPTLRELVEIAYEEFGRDERFSRRRVLRPLYTDAEAFDLLVSATREFGGEVSRRALLSIEPFARQLFAGKSLRNDRLAAALPSYQAPEREALARSTCAYLVRSRFGRDAA